MKTYAPYRILYCLLCLMLACSCHEDVHRVSVIMHPPAITPDYSGTVLPPNIAPANFRILEDGRRFTVRIIGDEGDPIVIRSKHPDIRIPEKQWKALLQANRGRDIRADILVLNDSTYYRYASIINHIAEEEIDRYLAYRLIEPSYVNYSILGIYQRCLENFDVRAIYTTDRQDDLRNKHCINCHTFKQHGTADMMFHVRGAHGGTLFIHDGRIEKINTQTDSTLSACVYPSYHPTRNKIAFSVNETRQTFHSANLQKVEVVDFASDLVLYDVDQHTIRPVLRNTPQMETFPTWAPDGKSLYFCSATCPIPDSTDYQDYLALHNEDIHYDLMRIAYDPDTDTFGKVDTVLVMSDKHSSIAFPRISPDGRHMLLCISDYGNFVTWHKSSDLYMLDLETGALEKLIQVNSDESEGFHNWSANGRWFVFSTRRDDGNYTRPYFAYFGTDGKVSKPFPLPQRDPMHSVRLMKSYNLPELTDEPVRFSRRTFDDVIMGDAGQAVYKP